MPAARDICVGELQIHPREHAVIVHGQDVPLTTREFGILMMLAEHPGWVLSASQLAGEAEEGEYSPESVSVLVSRLRQKLAAAGLSDAVETVRGSGYRLHSSAPASEEPEAAIEVRRNLRDASWQLQEAVIEVEHSGTLEQQLEATDALVRARHAVYATLAE